MNQISVYTTNLPNYQGILLRLYDDHKYQLSDLGDPI